MNTEQRKLLFDMLKQVAEKLTPELREKMVFVGGCTTCLFVDEASQNEIRSTEDVDLIISVLTHSDYRQFQDKLKELGFQELGLLDEEGPICRMKLGNTLIDLMPTHEEILGFTNKWYPLAFETAKDYILCEEIHIKLIDPVYFLATKLEAFLNRGNNDILESKDIEDILIILNGRGKLLREIIDFENKEVIIFIQEQFKILLGNHFFIYKLDEYKRSEDKINKILKLK